MAKNTAVAEGFTRFQIDLPTEIVIESRGTRVIADASKLSAEIVARLAEHGLAQKAGDSAANCIADAGFDPKLVKRSEMSPEDLQKVLDSAQASMNETLDQLYEGIWAVRRVGGAGVAPEVKARRFVLSPNLEAAYGKETWKAMEDDARNEALDSAYAGLDAEDLAKVDAAVARRLEMLEANRKAKASVSGIRVALKR